MDALLCLKVFPVEGEPGFVALEVTGWTADFALIEGVAGFDGR